MDWRIGRLGDAALLLELDGGIDPAVNARVHALAHALHVGRPAWVRDVVPAYASLAIFVDDAAFADADDPMADAERLLRPLLAHASDVRDDATVRCVEMAVRYGGVDGPDLQRVAEASSLTPDDVVRPLSRPTAAPRRWSLCFGSAVRPTAATTSWR